MDSVTLGRWQFGITTVYHFLFVPITIALAMMVAVLQTIWYKTGHAKYLQLTKFFGKLLLINFALGVVTGIVQEFQFGMNWSEYSRFVGDVFGAPLALEALLAFFLESTFLGLWIFGWHRLPKKIHLLTIWMVAFGTLLSSVFILAANSWMQNPVGTTFRNGRAELDGIQGFIDVLLNPVFLVTFPHVITAAFMTAGGLMAGVSGWWLMKLRREGDLRDPEAVAAHRFAVKMGAWVLIVASVLTIVSGDLQGRIMTQVQPMKMAAAEGLFKTETNAAMRLLVIGDLHATKEIFSIKVPGLLTLISGEETVQGVDNLREQFAEEGFLQNDGSQTRIQQEFAEQLATNYPGVDPAPNVFMSFWTFRLMIGLGMAGTLLGAALLWLLRKEKLPPEGKVWDLIWTPAMFALPLLPLFAISFGWIFTEMGRQPWLVAGVMPTAAGVSASVSAMSVLISMIVYTLLYGVLAVIEVGLFLYYVKKGLPDVHEVSIDDDTDADAPLSFAY
ncbi:MAG: cytochrome ubiquinol oxidase subunit I [Propionibacteriaceae bacterium]|nr:cytochrome ubiquinol oxidase subunit I [Propionibacteriaceae bacterium]